ncbi:MAG: PEP/pyruvate-binding domain-containing protein [Acidimicrobiales bacterium]
MAPPQAARGPDVVALDDRRATDTRLSGSKAAALATAAGRGLPVLSGFVITTAATAPGQAVALGPEVQEAWRELSGDGRSSLVVRSSSTVEDLAGSSMAGRYESVVGVEGWDAFVDAVHTVLASREKAAEGSATLTGAEPLAVLVQPLLDSTVGGVLFGVDPVSGRSDHRVVAASTKGPDALVSGRVDGSRYVLDSDGRVVRADHGPGGARLGRRQLSALARLAADAAELFGGHQDVEWAYDRRGALILLQSRPVTTEVVGVPVGPVLGPGPVSETFPEPLAPLEQGLWAEPLRQALCEALRLAGAATESELARSPVVVCIDGRVAIDLELTGVAPPQSPPSRLDPRPRLRRLRAAWRVGRLRAALPGLAEDLVERADSELAAVPALDTLSDRQLLALLDRGSRALVAAHAHEVLIGQLIAPDAPRLTGTSVALRVLAHARERGTADEDIAARHPVVLALTAPRIGSEVVLPRPVVAPPWRPGPERDHGAVLREALRLRVRWFQELTGRAAWVLGERLAERGVLDDPALVRWIGREELGAVVLGTAVPAGLAHRASHHGGDPLPARFRLTEAGRPVAVVDGHEGGGTGAGGGTGQGPVVHDGAAAEEGSVLVVRNLDPSLAPVLPRLTGLVAETGSVLAHVAILARESGLPTVVGFAGAVDRFPPGTVVAVDGSEGDVRVVEGPE